MLACCLGSGWAPPVPHHLARMRWSAREETTRSMCRLARIDRQPNKHSKHSIWIVARLVYHSLLVRVVLSLGLTSGIHVCTGAFWWRSSPWTWVYPGQEVHLEKNWPLWWLSCTTQGDGWAVGLTCRGRQSVTAGSSDVGCAPMKAWWCLGDIVDFV